MKNTKEIALYVLFGALTTLVNDRCYAWLTYFGVSNLLSTGIAWFLSVLIAFITNKVFVFQSRSFARSIVWQEGVSFFGGRIATGLLDMGIMFLAVDVLHGDGILWKRISNGIIIVLNYVLSKRFAFQKREGMQQMDAIVILGHRLNPDDTPTIDQIGRVDAAVRLWRETGIGRIVPCGGVTRERTRSEAEVMRELLLERGVPAEIITLEDASRTTSENIKNAKKILGSAKVYLVTADYHMDMALADCAQYDLDATPYPAVTEDAAYREQQRALCDGVMKLKRALREEAASRGVTEEELIRRYRQQAGSEEAFRALMRKKMAE